VQALGALPLLLLALPMTLPLLRTLPLPLLPPP